MEARENSTTKGAKGSSPADAAQQKPSKPLACTACRARKLGCNRVHPCYNCVRSGAECVFPARRRIQKPRKTKNTELLQRLSRLESIVSKVGVNPETLQHVITDSGAAGAGGGDRGGGGGVASAEVVPEPLHQPTATLSAGSGFSAVATKPRLRSFLEEYQDAYRGEAGGGGDDHRHAAGDPSPQERASSRYMNGLFWANLCGEVEGLRQALEHSTDSDEEEDDDAGQQQGQSAGTTPESLTSAAAETSPAASAGLLPGYLQLAASGHLAPPQHPPPHQVQYLASVYFANFDVIVKILHRPTTEAALYRFADSGGDRTLLTPEQEALFFAMYYAAVTTLRPEACATHLGRDRRELARAFQAGLEHCLARADYLNSDRLETLQALVIYIACLRCHSGTRTSWALLSLPVRLAQALGLHREKRCGGGSKNSYSPYETELRRRLWWQLIVLDIRGVEDRGAEPIVARGSYDTRLPLNLNDADFGPDTPGPLVERPAGEPTDITFSLSTAQSSGIYLYLNYTASASHTGEGPGAPPSEEEIIAHAQHLESQFVAGAGTLDPDRHVAAFAASHTVRLIILKLWLATRYPTHRRRDHENATPSPAAATSLLSTGQAETPPPPPPSSAKPTVTFTSNTITIRSSSSQNNNHNNENNNNSSSSGAAAATGKRTGGTGTGNSNVLVGRDEAPLRTALSILELSHRSTTTGPLAARFGWWSATYVQWHPLAVALAELCAQPRGALADRAWRLVDEVFPLWAERIADTKRGTLWRPIRKLYRKAKAARLEAEAKAAEEGRSFGAAAAGGGTKQDEDEEMPSVYDQTTMPNPQTSIPIPMPPTMIDTTTAMPSMVGPWIPPALQPPSMAPLDLNTSTAPSANWFNGDTTTTTTAATTIWPDIDFDIPMQGNWESIWSTWDEFVNDTQAERSWTSPSDGSETRQ